MNETRETVNSRADFIRWAGIGPELTEFVDAFIDKPEIFFSMSSTKRREIENQMDAILSAIGQQQAIQHWQSSDKTASSQPRGKGQTTASTFP